MLNNEAIILARPDVKERYEMQGFTFNVSREGRYFNLTLHVVASVDTNNTMIECRVVLDSEYNLMNSTKARLLVFTTFRGYNHE